MQLNDRICSQEGFPAKMSVSRGKAGGSEKELGAVYGANTPKRFAYYDPASFSLKTFQCSLKGDSMLSLLILPKWGMMRNGVCYQLPPLERCIKGNEFLSLPTPTVADTFTGNLKSSQQKPGSRHSVNLSQVFMLPTPQASDAWNTRDSRKRFNNPELKSYCPVKATTPSCNNLYTALTRLSLPTLTTSEAKGCVAGRYRGSPDFRGAKTSEALRTSKGNPAYLNPSFVEAIMGFPIGWTELNASEMPSSRRSRKP